MITVAELFVYPVKSCRGIALRQVQAETRGLQYDREWMVVTPAGRFLTQREEPRLALVTTRLAPDLLELGAPGLRPQSVPLHRVPGMPSREVTVWRDRVLATDEGDAVAAWLGEHLRRDVRLVRFDDSRPRHTDPDWSQGLDGRSAFSDGYPVLVLSQASLDDLNTRLPAPLPMDRFRPNVVLQGCVPYAEDSLHELAGDAVMLRLVKPCTRCSITTTDQSGGERQGEEPLLTLRSYRWHDGLRGVTFGQNAIVATTGTLSVGMPLLGR